VDHAQAATKRLADQRKVIHPPRVISAGVFLIILLADAENSSVQIQNFDRFNEEFVV
jgi:hypothetical protein